MDRVARQDWRAERYALNASFVAALGFPLLALLKPRKGESILDLGCGDGVLAQEIASSGARVVAVDASPEMVAAARSRGLDARVMDGHALAFEGEFDAVFSNAALHWMRQPEAVLAGVRRALKRGGRFVGEMGGRGNIASIRVALAAVLARRGIEAEPLSPFYFPSAEVYRARLESAGFAVEEICLFARPTVLPGSIEPWLETFADPFLRVLANEERPKARTEVADLLRPVLVDEKGIWIADYVRLRFRAVLAA